jgi:hypothetical protein
MDVRIPCLLPMEDGAAWAQVVAGIRSIDAVHGVLAQITFGRRFLHGLTTKFFKFELIDPAWCFEIKTDSPRVLTDRQGPRLC